MKTLVILTVAMLFGGCSSNIETRRLAAEKACIDNGGVPIEAERGYWMKECQFPCAAKGGK